LENKLAKTSPRSVLEHYWEECDKGKETDNAVGNHS
jgi:hypothetical protein